MNNSKTRGIDVDYKKAKIIKKAFEDFADKVSSKQLTTFLQKHGITRNDGRPLHLTSITNMLTNKFYIGILHYGGEYYEGSHQQFISKDLFQKVQEIVKRKVKPHKQKKFPFLGIAKCGECGASITAEERFKYYPTTRGKVVYIYYRCTKKLKPCTQKYLEEKEFEKQVRNILAAVALPQSWGKDWTAWMERDVLQEKQNAQHYILKLEETMKSLDEKLNKLLDGYLDGVIEQEIYKQKKNQLFEEKLKLQEEIATIREQGSSWLEPMKEFVNVALRCEKTARANNTNEELSFFLKTVGSNFFLANRQLVPIFKRGFNVLWLGGGSQSQTSGLVLNSSSVDVYEKIRTSFLLTL